MKKVNMKKYYPLLYNEDVWIEVSDEVAQVLADAYHAEAAYNARVRYHRAYFSLDLADGIENAALFLFPSAEDQLIQKLDRNLLYAAILQLPEKQAHRLYARFFLGLRVSQIAKQESVDITTVRHSIRRAIKNLKNFYCRVPRFSLFFS